MSLKSKLFPGNWTKLLLEIKWSFLELFYVKFQDEASLLFFGLADILDFLFRFILFVLAFSLQIQICEGIFIKADVYSYT